MINTKSSSANSRVQSGPLCMPAKTQLAPALNSAAILEDPLACAKQIKVIRRTNPQEAIRFGVAALERHPSHLRIICSLGRACESAGQFDEAKKYYERAFAQDPQCDVATNSIGQLALRRGDTTAAETWFLKTLSFKPKDAVSKTSLSDLYFELRDYTKALDWSQKAVRDCPEDVFALAQIGRVLRYQGKTEESRGYYQQALKIDPSSPVAWCGLGQLELYSGNIAQARSLFLKSIELGGSGPEPAMAMVADSYLAEGNFAQAKVWLDRAGGGKERPSLIFSRVKLLRYQGRLEEAETALLEALDAGLAVKKIYLCLSFVAVDLQNPKRAQDWLRIGAEKWPSDPDFPAFQGRLAYDMGEQNLAKELLGKALVTDPNNGAALRGMADMAWEEKDFDSVLEYNKRALCIHPANPDANLQSGRVLLTRTDFVGARRHLEAAYRAEPRSEIAAVLMAGLDIQEGNTDRALNILHALLGCRASMKALEILGDLALDGIGHSRLLPVLTLAEVSGLFEKEPLSRLATRVREAARTEKRPGISANRLFDLATNWEPINKQAARVVDWPMASGD